MKTHQEVENYFINKIDNLSLEKILDVYHFIISKVVENAPSDFAKNELEEEQPLLIKLHQYLSKPSINKEALIKILNELDKIVEKYDDDYPADMDFYGLTLINLASHYCEIGTNIEQEMTDDGSINEYATAVLLTYLDYLDFEQSDIDEVVDIELWADYPKIQQGIQELENFLES
ncbi:MAG: hypothetical protein Q3971_06300 [Moraxella sp.]|nr:hypothetical protein [Moraxella sp.]